MRHLPKRQGRNARESFENLQESLMAGTFYLASLCSFEILTAIELALCVYQTETLCHRGSVFDGRMARPASTHCLYQRKMVGRLTPSRSASSIASACGQSGGSSR